LRHKLFILNCFSGNISLTNTVDHKNINLEINFTFVQSGLSAVIFSVDGTIKMVQVLAIARPKPRKYMQSNKELKLPSFAIK